MNGPEAVRSSLPPELVEWSRFAESAPFAVYVVDPGGHYVYVNPRASTMTGFSRDELLGRHIMDVVPPEYRSRGNEHFASVKEGPVPAIELPFVRRDGSLGWGRTTPGPPIGDFNVAFVEDITEERRARRALEDESAVRQLLLRISETYLAVDPDELDVAVEGSLEEIGRLMGADHAWLHALHEGSAAVEHTLAWHADGPDSRGEGAGSVPTPLPAPLLRALLRGDTVHLSGLEGVDDPDFRAHLDGRGIRSLVAAPLLDGDDLVGVVGLDSQRPDHGFGPAHVDLLTTFAGMLVNVRRRRAAEEALRESEERFRTMCDEFTHVAIQGYGPDGTTQYWNRGSELIYGFSRDEALGRNLLELIIPDEMKDGVRAAMAEMARTGVAIPSAELRLQRRDGTRVEVYSSHWIVRRRRGDQELFCVDVDLSGVRRSEAERQALEEQLVHARRLESIGRLAGGVAHDFNNMLNVIQGFAELALDDPVTPAPTRENLEEILRAARRSATLTGQLLAFARRQNLAPRRLELAETVSGAARMLRRLVPESIALEVACTTEPPPVLMDAAQFEQALTNLVVNARDAMAGAGCIRLETGAVDIDAAHPALPAGVRPGRYATVTVTDDGPGMAADVLEHIFEPFFTTKEIGEGTGLGLATVYGVVRQHGGFIDVVSEPGRGARFTLHLPDADTLPPPEPDAAPATGRAEVPGPRTATILLVEDEPSVLRLTARGLGRRGHTVIAAGDPHEALGLAREHGASLDLLLTDMVMPGMSGPELARRLRTERPELPVLFMSGYAEPALTDVPDGIDLGRLVEKPFSISELERRVQELLEAK